MALENELSAAAEAAGAFLEADEELAAVLPAEPSPGLRVYLCAFSRGEEVVWLALRRRRLAASRTGRSYAMPCRSSGSASWRRRAPAAATRARARLGALLAENRPESRGEGGRGRARSRASREPPRVASPAYLDAVGAAAARLERALGELGPLAVRRRRCRSGSGAVEELADRIERSYKRPLG